MAGGYTRSEHSMQGVFIFVLLGMFAVMSTLMVLLCAQMYRATVDNSHLNSQERLLSAYVRSMVRAQDNGGTIEIGEEEGIPVLRMKEVYDDEVYVTRLYQHEGSLYELFNDEAQAFNPNDGTAICDAGSFRASMNGQLLTVNMTDGNGKPCEVRVAMHCVNQSAEAPAA